jgi:hypothetical protein
MRVFNMQCQYESADVCAASQSLVFIRMVFSDGYIKEELLKTTLLRRKTRGEDAFQSFYASLLEIKLPIHKLVSVTTEGAPAMITENVGSIGLC